MEQNDPNGAKPSDVFAKVFPEYMLYGMSYDEFWYGKPELAKYYREKHKLEIEQTNQQLWLQGLYIYDALAVVMSNAFSKRKDKYIEKPFDLFPPTEEEKEAKAEQIRLAMYEKLNAFKAEFEKRQGAE